MAFLVFADLHFITLMLLTIHGHEGSCMVPSTTVECYASVDCHGHIILSALNKGDCCAAENGRGLSFLRSGACENCFTEEAFTSFGTEYYVAFPNNLELAPVLSYANLRLGISTYQTGPASVVITTVSGMKKTTIVRDSAEVELDKDLKLTSISDRDKGLHIKSSGGGVSVVALSEEDTSADIFLVLPPVYLPDKYVYYALSVDRNATQAIHHSAILIVATENVTVVTVRPTASVNISSASDIDGTGVKGQSFSVILNEMETLYVASIESLSGSKAVSNKPITFISGHECGNIPTGRSFCDHMFEQFPPTSTWGKEFYTVPLKNRTSYDVIMIVASENSTSVTKVCGPLTETTIINLSTAGDVTSVNTSSEQYCSFISNKPVLVAQFAVAADVDNASADPLMMIVPPLEQYRNKYLITTFEPRYRRKLSYFVNVVLKTTSSVDRNSFLLNGSPVDGNWSDIFCGGNEPCAYGVQLDIDIASTSYVLSHENSSVIFSATVYSFGLRVGQGYAAGFNQKPVALDSVSFSAIVFEANESDATLDVVLYLHRSSPTSHTVTTTIRTRDLQDADSAKANIDYFPVYMEVVFEPEESTKLVSILLPEDDVFPEANKTLEVYLSATPGVYINPFGYAYATILNDDEPLTVVNISFGATSLSVFERNGFVELILTKSDGAVGTVSVNLTTADGTAVAGRDYVPLSTVISFEKEEFIAKARVRVINNQVLQQKRMFSAMIEVTSGLKFPTQVIDAVVNIEIEDDDMIVIGLNPVTQEVTEGNRAVMNMEILFGSLSKDVVVTLTTADESAKDGEDYSSLKTDVTFSESVTSNSVFIPSFHDNVLEQDESFSISLSHSEGESVLVLPSQSEIWIVDNSDVRIGLEAGITTVKENGTIPLRVRVVNGNLSFPVGVELSTFSRTAIGDKDFESIQSKRLLFDENTMEYNLSIAVYDNPVNEGPKNFAVQLSLVSRPMFLGTKVQLTPSVLDITILDNDDKPSITCHLEDSECTSVSQLSGFSVDSCCNVLKGKSVEFSAAGGTCQPCVMIGFNQPEFTLRERVMNHTIPVTVTGGRLPTATAIEVHPEAPPSSDDFILFTPNFELTKESSGESITLQIVLDDFRVEDVVESFVLQLHNGTDILPNNVVLGTAVISIVNVVPIIYFEQSVYKVNESVGHVLVAVASAEERVANVTFSIITTNNSATFGVDYYVTHTAFSLTPDKKSIVLDVMIIDDKVVENAEFFDLVIMSVEGAVLDSRDNTHIQIRDIDVATVGLMDVNYAVREDGGEISICVAVADETRADISFTVGFSTTDGTAVQGEDYEAVSAILTFSGELRKCVSVSIFNDTVAEENELFYVQLELMDNTRRIRLQNQIAAVEIINVIMQNVTVGFERTSYTISEVETQLLIIISAFGNFNGPINLMLGVTDVTTENDDYTLETPITIARTLSQFPTEISILFFDDCRKEENETLILSLTSTGQTGVIVVIDMASVTVLDSPSKLNDDVLQFFDLSAAAIPLPQQDDSISEAISPPEGFRVFGRTYSNLYVTTNGIITLGEPAVPCCPVRFEDIQIGTPAFVAPYWIDNDPSIQGNVSYSVFVQGDQLLEVSSFISRTQRTSFRGTWMVVAFWLDVPEALLEQHVNSYQALLVTDGRRSYGVFIYNCSRLDPQSVAGIGYYINESVYMEHPLASKTNSSKIACENSPCTPWNTIVYNLFDSLCEDGQIRLADEVVPGVGRVEICFNEEWGSVCDDGWDINDAEVVCRQLGLPSLSPTAIERAMFGEGEGPIWLDDIACMGTENELQDCVHNGVGINDCRHGEDASVACVFECDNGGVRLVGGNATAGRVEVCYNNVWGTICDDSWDLRDATVVCNQLGLSSSSPTPIRGAGFGEGEGVIWLDDVACVGEENSLQSCPSEGVGVHNCAHNEDAGVVCNQGLPQCFTNTDCTGDVVPAADQRSCCVETGTGFSYSTRGTCNPCVVHGFLQTDYDVIEGEFLDTVFRLNVKGMTQFSSAPAVNGRITAAADGTSSSTDFQPLAPITFTNMTNIRLFTSNDGVSLEYDDRVQLRFTPDNPGLIPGVEAAGEYIRDTTTIHIIDNDLLQINFRESDYAIVEGSNMLSTPIMLQFGTNQNPFTVRLSPVTIATAESMRLGFFINSGTIAESSRATAGEDFTDTPISITIPANREAFDIPAFFNISADNIDEYEQSFALVAEIGQDVPENTSCFQSAVSLGCFGRRGATEIRITDIDPMIIGFTERTRTISEAEDPTNELFLINIALATLRTAQREHGMTIRVQRSSSTAIVEPLLSQTNPNFDAIFGSRDNPGEPIVEAVVVPSEANTIPSLRAAIRNDFVPEDDECFTIRIFPDDVPGRRELFMCNEDSAGADNYFCQHTTCIVDDDSPFVVAFVETTYTVDESVGAVNVCVNLTQPQIDILDENVNVFVIDNSNSVYIPAGALLATPDAPDFLMRYLMVDGTDFAQQTLTVNTIDDIIIRQRMRIVCYNQPIYEDLHLEPDEYAGLTLGVRINQFTTVLTEIQPMYDQASILILDNDRARVGLETTFRVMEGVGVVKLCAIVYSPNITCPIAFPFDVELSTSDGTAVQTMDYGALAEVLMFDSCETRKCVNVAITDDFVDEVDEFFTFHLLRTPNLDSRIDLDPVDGRIEIVDDDLVSELQYLDLGTNVMYLRMVDDSFSAPISVPGQIPVFGQVYSNVYVVENGIIYFGMVNDEFTPSEFSTVNMDTNPFVAPYWIENDISQGGSVSYSVFTGNSNLLFAVSNFISQSQCVEFNATWMLVANWTDVPLFGSSDDDTSNTHQAIVVTDASSTYAIFTYQCNDLDNSTLGGRIGYYNDSCNFMEHPLSVAEMSFMVACENELRSPWSNIVYSLTSDTNHSLQLLELGATPGIERVFLPIMDDALSGNISSPSGGFPLIGTTAMTFNVHTNGLIFIDGKIGLVTPQMFSSIASGSFIAPYWVDNNPSMGGSVSYEVHNDGSALLRQVSCAISSRENINFRGTWMLVVYWFNVPLFERTVTSTYQGILITDGSNSFTMYMYQCGGVAADTTARIGYYISPQAYVEHPLSGSQPSVIACGEAVIYKLTI